MSDTVHSSCKRCGQPMTYDPNLDMMVCPDCGYKEKVKNNVTINKIVNNNTIQTQGNFKSNAESDDDYRYVNCIKRLQTYLEQEDADSIAEIGEELRRNFPNSYFYAIFFTFQGNLTNLMIDPTQFLGIKRQQTQCFIEDMKSPAFKENSDGFNGLNYDMQIKSYEVLEQVLGELPDDSKVYLYDNEGKKREATVDYYLKMLTTALNTINSLLSEKITKHIKYDIDKEHHQAILQLKKEIGELVAELKDLSNRETDFAIANIGKVQEVVDMGAGKSIHDISYLVAGKKSSGLIGTLIGFGIYFVFLLIGIILIISVQSLNLLDGWMVIFSCIASSAMIADQIAMKRQGIKIKKRYFALMVLSLLFSFIWPMSMSVSEMDKNRWLLLIAYLPTGLFELSLLAKLPKMIKEHKEIKANKAEYNHEIDEAMKMHEMNSSAASYDEVFDMILDFDFDFSSWEE